MTPEKIRLIDEQGKQLGIFDFDEASKIAQEKGFNLVLITNKTTPPVYKLGNYDKLKYQKEKELRKKKLQERHSTQKSVRLGFNEGEHDLNTKIKKVEKFLEERRAVAIEMKLRGREKAHFDLAKEKINNFCLKITVPYKIIQPLKKTPQGLTVLLKQ
ncbi:MAG: translation initiation factor IF-3 [Candidatus Pacebacteria bacterium]|nr:translation initiation factor IF-3 [Candidatus Paceibacterota bacterium]